MLIKNTLRREVELKKNKLLKINLSTIFIIVLLLFVAVGAAHATTYYVSPSGIDGNNGSVSAPFKTIQKAADIVNSGDTVIVKDGVYTDTNSDNRIVDLNRGGTSSNWITFKSENKWGAKLNGQSNSTSLCWVFGPKAQHIRIEGFEVYGCKDAGFHTQDADYGYLYENNVHDIGRRCTNEAYGQSGIFMGAGATHWTFDSNVVHHIGRYRVGENGCQESVCNTDLDRCGMLDPGMYLNGAYGDVINNVFYENSSSNHLAIKGSYCVGCGSHYRVINNTFGQSLYKYNNTFELIACDSGYRNYVDDVIIANNLFATSKAWNMMMWCPERMTNIVIKNNMTQDVNLIWPYGPQAWGWNPYTDPHFTISGNYEKTPQSFVNYATYDFRLQSNSPAINKGINVGVPYESGGKLRVGNPDIGAYEYGASSTPLPLPPPANDTTLPSVPTGLTATVISSSQINLSWSASTDNVKVSGYKLYRGTSLIAITNTTYSNDTGLSPSTIYTYRVSAYDAAGNESAQSAAASATTTLSSFTYLSDLTWLSATNGWGPVEKDRSNGEILAGDGRTITLNGVTYGKGIGVHAASDVRYNIAGQCSTFLSDIGVDDEAANNGSVVFQVFGDGVKLYDSGIMTGSSQTKQVSVNVGGKNTLQLVVTDAGNGNGWDHADWANARIICNPK